MCELEQPTRTLGWRADCGNWCVIISTITPRKRVVPATLPCAEVPVAAAVKSYSALHVRRLETGAVKVKGSMKLWAFTLS